MDSIGAMLNPIGKMPKTHYTNECCNGFTGKKLIVYNGILMETIEISVMVSIGLDFFSRAGHLEIVRDAAERSKHQCSVYLHRNSDEKIA